MKDWNTMLERYARLVVKVGVNVQPGQVLMVHAPLETAELTRKIVASAYEAGAKYVLVDWEDEQTSRIRFEKGPDESFDYYPKWQADMLEKFAEEGGAALHIKVPNPDLYDGIDSEKVSRSVKAAAVLRQNYQAYTRNNRISWALIKAPTAAWADKVFADLPEEERIPAMWEAIFRMNRVNTPDPVAAWEKHLERLRQSERKLNAKRYRSLHYRAPGTDLRVELPEGHIWRAAGGLNDRGVHFVANMPTEEVYSMPKRTGVNGTVSSTLPLNLNGRLVDGIRLTFKDGRVESFEARSGKEHLTSLLATDEGASYLGEVALVPHNSPISQMNRVFYNTGIDENASCHFALGSSYPVNLEGGAGMSREELLERGANVSLTHVDFMIGCAELDIDGELQDGTWEPVFRAGNWA
ncbi:aminopeptidase [Paenibacillus spiritus]|uniref:Aminopeptidase n=1 Tax=Paenibacillus spiritus TaxID=2496557 RepID=A0A5J5G8H4_9BACL|nr:aminopeptidase [Paenibacillus spiritus]KAA9004110.1 aminopeptidase [Paenibacillus spiritus]